jgi:hypothetical protein
MRPSTPFLLCALLAIAPNVRAQSVAAPSAPAQSPAAPAQSPAAPAQPPAASAGQPKAAQPARHSHKRQAARVAQAAHAGAPKGTAAGVDLGATDITGNKELPKVMVIVPWKDSLGAGGVIKPTDSLLDDVLQPVDRGVFQRQIRYYGQLDAAAAPAPGRVAPVGDSH